MQKPHELHWKDETMILHYVQGTTEFGIHYYIGAQLYLIGFTDSYWVGDRSHRKYTSGFVFMLVFGPICWSSKKQATLSLSLDEVEYRGAVNAAIHTICLMGF